MLKDKSRWLKVTIIMTIAFGMLVPTIGQASPAVGNDYPIILVHGIGHGFGDNINYWGGFTNLRRRLEADGHKVYIAYIGPLSSNWDRAAELYAFIKGGRVDYGAAHSAEHGHNRYGRTFPGLYPEWGELNPKTGKINKVHLVGHSMGGTTSRMLVQLLEKGCTAEIAATSPESLSPLFSGKLNNWVSSVTSISTPHDGAVIAEDITRFIPLLQELIVYISRFSPRSLFDFHLDHWGIRRQRGETNQNYHRRVWDNPVWRTKDVSLEDLRPVNAAKINTWVKAQPNVYYFSIANESTFRGSITRMHFPRLTMIPLLRPTATIIGRNSDASLRENDGMVSTKSMLGPTLGSTDQIVSYNGNPEAGKWNYIGKQSSFCHASIIGLYRSPPVNMYRDLARTLRSLPTNP